MGGRGGRTLLGAGVQFLPLGEQVHKQMVGVDGGAEGVEAGEGLVAGEVVALHEIGGQDGGAAA